MRSTYAPTVILAGVAISLASCYDVPQPECGFTCGPPAVAGGEGTCPDGYVCFTSVDNRCHRVSPPFTDTCPGDAAVPVDLRPPQLVYRTPAPDATGISLTRGLVEIGFDEPVFGVDFPNFVVEDSTGIIPASIGGSQVGNEFHFTYQPQRPYFANTVHTVRVTDGITDTSGNHFLGVEWMFTTEPDNTPPTATLQNPATTTGVPVNTSIDISFSEPVMGVNNSTFTLTGPAGLISGNVTPTASPTSFVSLDPFVNLQPATQYTVTLSNTITDLAGNALSFTPVTFTTASDTQAPMVSSTSPMNNAVGVAVNMSISVGFTEAVTGVNGTTFSLTGPSGLVTAIVTSTASSGNLNPTHQLLPNTTYNYSLTNAILDLAGNPLVPFNGVFMTGADTVPPSVIGRVPILNGQNVPVNTTVLVDFDENVTNADATTIQLVSGTAVPATVTYATTPSFRATLTPSVQLAANTTYTVTIAPSLQDASGNMFGTPPTVWTFMTGADTIVPQVSSTAPADNTIDVPVDATVSVTFDEPVTGVDATSFVVMNAGTGTLASSNGGRTWTFTPDAAMPANTTVTIMLTMAIEDAAGNALVPFTFDFTTAP